MSENTQLLTQPFSEPRIGDYLTEHLLDPRWKRFRAAVAFVRQSGVRHIRDSLLAMLCPSPRSSWTSFGGQLIVKAPADRRA